MEKINKISNTSITGTSLNHCSLYCCYIQVLILLTECVSLLLCGDCAADTVHPPGTHVHAPAPLSSALS